MTPTFSFRQDDPEDDALRSRFESTLEFGGRISLPAGYVSHVEIEASPEARLLLPNPENAATSEFTLATSRDQIERPIRCAYQVIDGQGVLLGEFPVYLRHRTAGARGTTLYGSDAAQILSFEVSIPYPPEAAGRKTLTMPGARLQIVLPQSMVGYDIESLLPIVHVLSLATEGNSVRFDLPGLGYMSHGPLATAEFPATPALYQFLADLDRMQEVGGSVLQFPANVTNRDVQDLRTAVRVLDGESVEYDGGLTLNLRPEAVNSFLEALRETPGQTGEGTFIASTDKLELQVGDLTIPYGAGGIVARGGVISNWAELEQIAAQGQSYRGQVNAQLVPQEHPFCWMSRQEAERHLELR